MKNNNTMSIQQFSQISGIKRELIVNYIEENYPLFHIGKNRFTYGFNFSKTSEKS